MSSRQYAPAPSPQDAVAVTPEEILDTVLDTVIFVDHAWCVLYLNDMAAQMFGCSTEQARLRPLWDLLPDAGELEPELRETADLGRTGRVEWHCPALQSWFEIRIYRSDRGRTLLITDITPRKEAQEALRLSEQRFRAALKNAPISVYNQDRELRYTWAHNSPPGAPSDAVLGRRAHEFLPPDEAAALVALKRRVLDSGTGARQDLSVHIDGQPHYYDLTVEPLRDATGEVAGITCAAADVTPYRTAEERLRKREAQLALAQEVAGIGSWEWDIANNAIEWSAEYHRMLGLRPGEVKPTYELFFDLVLPEDRARVRRRVRQAIESGRDYRQEYRMRRKDGAVRLLQGRAKVVYDAGGRPARLVGTCQDITERRQAEEALRDSEERYRRLVELSPDALFVVTGGHVAYANQASLQLFGVPSAADLLGRSPLEFVEPNARAEVARKLQRVLKSGQSIEPAEVQWQRADGVLMELEVAAAPLPWDGSDGVQVILHDITERKRSQRALAEADRRKDEFIAMLAHELRNPMAPIRNAAHLLRASRMVKESERRWSVDVIERQVEHMSRLVDDLLDVARITRGHIELKKREVDVSFIIEAALETACPDIEARQHELQVGLPPEALRLHADPERLTQVVANLLQNAAKYTDPGGRITLSVEAQPKEVQIRVRDNGMGIDSEALTSIFEPFSQSEQSLARSRGGLGLGLTLVHRLVQLHGGAVNASSSGPGQGSEFIVRLPHPDDSAPEAQGDGGPGAEAGKRRVLVVEDNEDVARSFALLLNAMGHEVKTATSGAEGLKAAPEFKPQVVFLDIGLPDMDGYEVARRLRSSYSSGDLLLVALTGYGQRENDTRARDAGFDHYLLKPGDMETIERLLGGG